MAAFLNWVDSALKVSLESVQWLMSYFANTNRWSCDRLGRGRTAGPAAGARGKRSAADLGLQGHAGACSFTWAHHSWTLVPLKLTGYYSRRQGSSNNWLRVVPRTRFGAFARGAKVTAFTGRSGAMTRIIDGGSGYLCEMEPVAHFGLGMMPQFLLLTKNNIPSMHVGFISMQ